MFVWEYDGSFEGLLTVVYYWFYTEERPEKIIDSTYAQSNLLWEVKSISTELNLAEKVAKGIVKKLGEENFERVMKVYWSEEENRANLIINFLKYGFSVGPKAIEDLANPAVGPFYKASSAVSRESHKLLGLLRFKELSNGIFYAGYESTYNQLFLISPHFADRLSTEVWVIHDLKRELASFYQKGSWHIAPLSAAVEVTLASQEMDFDKLWKTYYEHIAITERKNLKLRTQNMPKKYWKYLNEIEK